ncbi:MAG: asparagine synthase-related protein, partial [Gammaproteobacteria bacterium]
LLLDGFERSKAGIGQVFSIMAEAGVERLKTYSVGFETVNGLKGDEFTYSDLVARHFDTDHHKISVSSEALLSALPDAITAMSEPMVSHDCIGFYLLSQAVSRTCRAVQSGQGADEVFGGYHWYRAMASSAPFESYRKAFFDRDYNEYQKTVSAEYGVNDIAGQFVQQHFDAIQTPCGIDKALHLDTTVMLVDDPVKRVDNMTMAWGLEARVPYLDHHLVEFAAQIPADFKVSGEGKMILKEAARSVIPAAVIDRPKGYFPVPALTYLRGHVLTYVQDALTNAAAQKRGLFQRAYLNRLLSAPEEHITPLRGSKLWQLGLLELWLQSMNI